MSKLNRRPSKRTMLIVAALLIATAILASLARPTAAIDETNPVGLIDTVYVDETRSRTLNLYAWYPTDHIAEVALVEENAVFHGFSAIQNAGIDAGTYPLIVLSHGSGGNRANQGWLAKDLARQGAIVVAANHLGSTSRDSAPATNILTWNRPEDISFIIDSVLADPQFADHIDPSRIAVVGHSLGGYTALAVGGMEISLDRFIKYCNEFPNNADCAFYSGGKVDIMQVDRSKFEQNHRDERVSAVVAIDPAYARSFEPESLTTMANTLLIAAPVENGDMGDLKVDYLGSQLSDKDSYIKMDGAHHFTYLPECKPVGYYLLMIVERGGELLCTDEQGKSRAEYHEMTSAEIISFLTQQSILK